MIRFVSKVFFYTEFGLDVVSFHFRLLGMSLDILIDKDIQTHIYKADLSSRLHFCMPDQRMAQYGTPLYHYCRHLYCPISSMLYNLAQWKMTIMSVLAK